MFQEFIKHKLMKFNGIWNIWAVFLISITVLLLFQGIWLYNSYQMKRNELEEVIDIILQQSINEEVELRHLQSGDKAVFVPQPPKDIDLNAMHALNHEEVTEAGIFQQVLHLFGNPFKLSTLDSIFHSKLVDENIRLNYLLCYEDSTGTLIENSGDLALLDKKNSFTSARLLIVDGQRVYVRMNISLFAVSDRMLWLLIGSFLMLILIVACIIYQIRIIFSRHKLNQLREDFTNALTHDMKTPLSTIHGVLTQLTGNQLNDCPEIKETFNEIAVRQMNKLQKMIDQILTTGKYEHGKIIVTLSEVDIDGMIKGLTERFEIMQAGKKIIFSTKIELQDTAIHLDMSLMENALANLIDNAIKYSGDPVHISINCALEGKRLIIRIKDDGFGIPRKDRKKIFEKFERGVAAWKKETSGFGLGLTYVKSVTEAHGGCVELNSIEGEGSEFILKIPLVKNN